MLILRDKTYSSQQKDDTFDKTTAGYVAGAGGLMGSGGALIGTSTKKAEEKAIKKLNKNIDNEISKLPDRELKEAKEAVKWRKDRLQKEGEIIDRRMQTLNKQKGIKGKINRGITKYKAKQRRKKIEDIYDKKYDEILRKSAAEKKRLNNLREEGAKKIKTKMQARNATGQLLALGGIGLGAAAGYRYYKKKKNS